MASNQKDMLDLALAVNTGEAGDAAAKAIYKDPSGATDEKHLDKKAAKQQKKLDELTKYTKESRVLHRTSSFKGEPVVEAEKFRKLFLKPLKITQTAIVLRHWPVGKGFILRAPEALMAEVEEGRPPYIFVKIWSIKNVDDGRLIEVQYDVRDVGTIIDRDNVIFFPEEANKALLLWEHAQKVADGRLPPPEKAVAAAVVQLRGTEKASNKFKALLKNSNGTSTRKGLGSTVSQLQRRSSKQANAEAGVKI